MLGSHSHFFTQEKEILEKRRNQIIFFLKDIWNREEHVINFYLKAYDFFCENPDQFDGATIVKDLSIIPNLDIWAMIHDYLYLRYKVSVNIKYKWYADLIYALEMEKMGCAAYSTWTRFTGLTVFAGIFFTPIQYLKGKRMSKEDKLELVELYRFFRN